jgi:dCMP deaminase
MDLEKQNRIDNLYLRMAFAWSENSYAIRRKVGCLIVKDNSIISDGYNGTPSGFPNVCESVVCTSKWRFGCIIDAKPIDEVLSNPECIERCKDCKYAELTTHNYVLHAEANAITKLSKSHNSSIGATIYVTDEPCIECSKLIIQAGIKRVVYAREYRMHDGIELLKKAGIEVQQIHINN